MSPSVLERWHDYAFTLSAGLAAGAVRRDMVIPLDSDAPFSLRAIALFADVTSGNDLALRYRDPNGRFLQTDLERRFDFRDDATLGGIASGAGRMLPVYPQVTYPPQGTLQFDLQNFSGNPQTKIQVVFRGVKSYYPNGGAASGRTYPEPNRRKPFFFALPIASTPGGIRRQVPLLVGYDADFAIRSLVYNVRSGNWAQARCQIFDGSLKPFSNEPIQVPWVFAADFFPAGASRPGLVYPEYYLPRGEQLYVDFYQDDGLAATTVLVFAGDKIR